MLIKNNFDLTGYNSYRVKARCAIAYFPQCEEDIFDIFKDSSINKIILGGGYNTILTKKYYKEAFVIFDQHYAKASVDNYLIKAQAGVSMFELSNLALEYSLSGLEIFYDIPSSLGGAIVMNAGAGGEEIKNLLVSVRYFDPIKLSFYEKLRDEIEFEYRNSFFQKNPHLIITSATLQLSRGEKSKIQTKMQETKAARWAKQPKEYPNAGSVFKRPAGKFVGPMIEELGLKGYAIGGAKVSEKHAGFIVNFDQATGEDIIKLIEHVKCRVFEQFALKLEIEQRII